jgi:hypothetical protein
MKEVKMNSLDIKKIDKELGPLYKEKEKLEKKISSLYHKRLAIKNQIDLEYSKKIPENVSKITKQQWEWILSAGHGESQVQYKFSSKILEEKFGFYRTGFRPETKQTALNISQYGLNTIKLLEGFEYLKKYLKPVTIEDKRHGTETGIRFEVSGLDDSYSSVIYIHKDKTVALYQTSYSSVKNFKNFKEFLNWYSIRLVEIEKQGFDD